MIHWQCWVHRLLRDSFRLTMRKPERSGTMPVPGANELYKDSSSSPGCVVVVEQGNSP